MKYRALSALLVLCASPIVLAQPMDAYLIGDLRGGAYGFDDRNRDGTERKETDFRARIRAGLKLDINERWDAYARVAGRYSDEQDQIRFSVDDFNSVDQFGEGTLDMLYADYQPRSGLSLRVGRMQTKFELEGVAKKSLDRNDSPNVDIHFTDGLYVIAAVGSGWDAHFIVQRNPEEGSTNETRGPLDFSNTDGNTRATYFLALERKNKKGVLRQRGIDLTVMPNALVVDTATAERDDYIAVVARNAMQWPLTDGGMDFLWGLEAGYAPNTPNESEVNIGTTDSAGGIAWQTTFNLLDFAPKNSIGLVVGQAEAGWLISPDFPNNDRLLELRHAWKINKQTKLETRVRQRKELEQQTGATVIQKRDRRDYYVRLTYKFK